MNVAVYEQLYGIDLVYQPDCYKLCGDAHCCSFTRHKSNFRVLGKRPFQELPLLPGEYDFLAQRGYLAQFGEHERKASSYAIDEQSALFVDSVVSYRAGGCVCDHAIRPVVCRLYPLLPVLDEAGRLSGTEPFGVYEELERVAGLEPACRLANMPFGQLELFLALTRLIADEPLLAFHLSAYRIAKKHVAARLAAARKGDENVFAAFEWSLLRKRLFDHTALRAELAALRDRFCAHWGARFSLPSSAEVESALSRTHASNKGTLELAP